MSSSSFEIDSVCNRHRLGPEICLKKRNRRHRVSSSSMRLMPSGGSVVPVWAAGTTRENKRSTSCSLKWMVSKETPLRIEHDDRHRLGCNQQTRRFGFSLVASGTIRSSSHGRPTGRCRQSPNHVEGATSNAEARPSPRMLILKRLPDVPGFTVPRKKRLECRIWQT